MTDKYDLTGKTIQPLNAPIGALRPVQPQPLPFQPVANGQSVSEGLCPGMGEVPFNPDGTPNPLRVPPTIDMMIQMYQAISQPVSLLSMGAIPGWHQSVIDNNGGYAKNFIVYEPDIFLGHQVIVKWRSEMDQNINIKPRVISHDGWTAVEITTDEPGMGQNKNVTYLVGSFDIANEPMVKIDNAQITYFKTGSSEQSQNIAAYYSIDGSQSRLYKDINMPQPIGQTDFGEQTVLYLAKGTVIILGHFAIPQPGQDFFIYYPIKFISVSRVHISSCFTSTTSLNTVVATKFKITQENNVGFMTYSEEIYPVAGTYIVIGKLLSYVGDTLSEIRNYKNTPYYKQLSQIQKDELDTYYIHLDETKDLAKVNAPIWWEKEIEGKSLTD